MWAPLAIAPPLGDAAAILAGLPATLRLLSVDPWQHGIGQGSGTHTYLSFPNAVEAVIARLPPDYDGALLALGIAAASLDDLGAGLAGIAAGFPLPHFAKAARRAASLAKLETEKFNLPPAPNRAIRTISTHSLPVAAAMKRAALLQESAANILALAENPFDGLAALAAEKLAADTAIGGALDLVNAGLSGWANTGHAWRCYADADHAAALRAGAPDHRYTLSTVTVFLGTPLELALLAEVLNAVA